MILKIEAFLVFDVHPQEAEDNEDYNNYLYFYERIFPLIGFQSVQVSEAIQDDDSSQLFLQQAALGLTIEHESTKLYEVYNLIQIAESILKLHSSFYSLNRFDFELQ